MNIFHINKNSVLDPSISGYKAFNLQKIIKKGLSVPDLYVIHTKAYNEHLKDLKIPDTNISIDDAKNIQKKIINKELNNDFLKELKNTYKDIRRNNSSPIAVRSSSPAEDLDHASAAGIYLSFLNISTFDDLVNKLKKCWSAYWSFESIKYREKNNIPHKKNGMALIIQKMVEAKYSGVLFTTSPTKENKIHLEWIEGLGENLVDGVIEPNRLLISKNRSDIKFGEIDADSSFLNSFQELIIATKSISIEEEKDFDFEWSIDMNSKLWFLQMRPITLGPKAVVDYNKDYFSHHHEPFSTFGLELAINRYYYWVKANRAFYFSYFENKYKVIDEELFFKTGWLKPSFLGNYWMNFIKVFRLITHKYIISKYHNYTSTVNEKINFFSENITFKNSKDIFKSLESCIELYNNYQLKSISALKIVIMEASIFKKLCTIHYGEKIGHKYFSKTISAKKSITMVRDEKLNELIIKLNDSLSDKDVDRIKNYKEFTAFIDRKNSLNEWKIEFNKFIEKYGYIWSTKYPRDPIWVLNDKAIFNTLFSTKTIREKSIDSDFNDKYFSNINYSFINKYFFKPIILFIANLVKNNFHIREDRNHYVYTIVGLIKYRLNLLGEIYFKKKLLEQPKDIFFLKIDDIKNLVFTNTNNYFDIAKKRRMRYHLLNESKIETLDFIDSKQKYFGECCVEGIVEGRINKIAKIGDLDTLKEGDILVCKSIRPAWSYVFSRVNGVIIESGGLLSHGATLLREHNTPSIINVKNIFKSIPQHSKVIMNCKKGVIDIQ